MGNNRGEWRGRDCPIGETKYHSNYAAPPHHFLIWPSLSLSLSQTYTILFITKHHTASLSLSLVISV